MSITAIVVLIVGLYLAFKLAGFLLKLAMWGLVAVAIYALLAPQFGWPWPF